MARKAAFDIVTKKVLDLGIVSPDKAADFRQEQNAWAVFMPQQVMGDILQNRCVYGLAQTG